jgi:hypothetical protein
VELAVQVTEARYGAIGVLGPGKQIGFDLEWAPGKVKAWAT